MYKKINQKHKQRNKKLIAPKTSAARTLIKWGTLNFSAVGQRHCSKAVKILAKKPEKFTKNIKKPHQHETLSFRVTTYSAG